MKRYAAKLLFQFRVKIGRDNGKRRICEERIILLQSDSARGALSAAKQRGDSGQYTYRNSDGNPVHFEFIGVRELLCLGPECEPDEVWYEIKQLLLPKERKRKLLPAASDLHAVRNETEPPSAGVTSR